MRRGRRWRILGVGGFGNVRVKGEKIGLGASASQSHRESVPTGNEYR